MGLCTTYTVVEGQGEALLPEIAMCPCRLLGTASMTCFSPQTAPPPMLATPINELERRWLCDRSFPHTSSSQAEFLYFEGAAHQKIHYDFGM